MANIRKLWDKALLRFVSASTLDKLLADFDYYTGANSSGPISRETALTLSAVWRGVSLISGYVGKTPLDVYARSEEGRIKVTGHMSYRLLRNQPNELQSALQFRQTLQGHALLQGNGYALIIRDRSNGRPQELLILNPEQTHFVRKDGQPWYVTRIGNEDVKLDPSEVLHIRGMGFDGMTGYSLVEFGAMSLGKSIGAQKHSKIFFDQGTSGAGVLETPGTMKEPTMDRLRKQWAELNAGVANHHKPIILQGGLTFKQLQSNGKDAQLIESMKFTFTDVANWLGVPPHKLGDDGRTAYNSLEEENRAFLGDALDYWFVVWEQECWDKLLSEKQKERGTHYVEFNRESLIRADLKTRGAFYKMATGGRSWMTPNEVRETLNMNTLGGDADELKDPTNNFGEQSQGEEGTSERSIELAQDALADGLGRMIRRAQNQLAKKTGAKRTEYLASLTDGKELEFMRTALTPAVELVEELTDEDHEMQRALKAITEAVKDA